MINVRHIRNCWRASMQREYYYCKYCGMPVRRIYLTYLHYGNTVVTDQRVWTHSFISTTWASTRCIGERTLAAPATMRHKLKMFIKFVREQE